MFLKNECFCPQDKGKCIILMNTSEYYNVLHHSFEDKNIFQELDSDPSKKDCSELTDLLNTFKTYCNEYNFKLLKPSEKIKCGMVY